MKPSVSIIERRLPTLVVGLVALLLTPGCRHLHPTFQKASNPRVCPVCVAATPEECHCFPTDVGAGYSETHWGRLASTDPLGNMVVLHADEAPAAPAAPAAPLIETKRKPAEVMLEPAEPRRRAPQAEVDRPEEIEEIPVPLESSRRRPSDAAKPASSASASSKVPLEKSATDVGGSAASTASCLEPKNASLVRPATSPDVGDALAIPPVLVAKLAEGDPF